MTGKNSKPRLTDYYTDQPVVHPEGKFETRPVNEGEIGHTGERLAHTAIVSPDERLIGEIEEPTSKDIAGPTVLGAPDLNPHGNPVE